MGHLARTAGATSSAPASVPVLPECQDKASVGNAGTRFHDLQASGECHNASMVHGLPLVVMVSGLPGAGKSTMVRALAAELVWPVLSKDVVKEALYDRLGVGDRAWSRRLGAAASDALWALLAEQRGNVLIESVFSSADRQFIDAGLASAGVKRVAQVVCDCPPDEALRRFWLRAINGQRHPGHAQSPAQADEQDELAWQRLAVDTFDLGIGPVLRVDTTAAVDVAAVAVWIRNIASAKSDDQQRR